VTGRAIELNASGRVIHGGTAVQIRQPARGGLPPFERADSVKQIKTALKKLLGEPALGAIDYWRHPEMRRKWGGPFNGQSVRAALFQSLIVKFKPSAIIETGTYLGSTSEFMAQTGLPIFTVEGHPRNFGFSRARLFGHRRVKVRLGDSRKVLRELFNGPLRNFTGQTLFAYLDAHWNADLPLAEEIELVFTNCPGAVVMIDDFKVPFDTGYGYDDYGAGNALTAAYIESNVRAHGLQVFYPSGSASAETGKRRGCVVLAKKSLHGAVLASLPGLRSSDS
jgi:predicted O-methyltransferase YrrM